VKKPRNLFDFILHFIYFVFIFFCSTQGVFFSFGANITPYIRLFFYLTGKIFVKLATNLLA